MSYFHSSHTFRWNHPQAGKKKTYSRHPSRAGFPLDCTRNELSEGCLWQHCSPVLLHKQPRAKVRTRESSPCEFMISVTWPQPQGGGRGQGQTPSPLEHTIPPSLTFSLALGTKYQMNVEHGINCVVYIREIFICKLHRDAYEHHTQPTTI